MKLFCQTYSRLRIVPTLTLCIAISAPTLSRADIIYQAITLADVGITGFLNHSERLESKPHDLLIAGNASIIGQEFMLTGNAFADQLADAAVNGINTNDLVISDGLSQQAIAAGEAIMGTAASFALTQGILAINNLSQTESYTIDFEADWTYLVDASITHVHTQFATALSEISLESHLHRSLFDLTVSSDSDLGGGLLTDNKTQAFSIFLLPGESDVLNLTVNAAGVATTAAPVPEPSTRLCLVSDCLGQQSCNGAYINGELDTRNKMFLKNAHNSSRTPNYFTGNHSLSWRS
ncbi:MAG: hypothetical protein NPIRA01_38210 [Nitrospirales bacterium]|nr:MAG: hypothetical protein NPIRA01_38210 [Nitrospirales bacterium]